MSSQQGSGEGGQSGGKRRTIQFGEYTVVERLGEGGMCHVFRARKRGEVADCALKVLKDELRNDERVVNLFLTEADVALLLEHPNLITTFDAGEINGHYYIAMELIEGRTLDELVAACHRDRIQIPVDFSLYVISEILEGLHGLHTAVGKTGRPLGVVHRDVTPQNIFISFEGRVILGDFGVAHIQAYGDSEPGQAIGKIGYLSPEVVLQEEIDHRSDIFGAGIVLWELLTDERLFESGTDEQLMEAIAEARVPRPRTIDPNLSRGLENALMRALSRRAKDRFESAEEMIYELEPFWSKLLGNPKALSAFMAGIFREEVREWQSRKQGAELETSDLSKLSKLTAKLRR
jgi:eukaryotic-like serine/threonine-protein kinase